MMRIVFQSLFCLFIAAGPALAKTPATWEVTDHWLKTGQAAVADRLAVKPIPGPARNVILFIGDGMGVSTVTAARILDGQAEGKAGEEHVLSFEHFPHVALVKTYNVNQQVSDSAGTASAMHTGVKTRAGVIGLAPAARRGVCERIKQNTLPNLAHIAAERGKAVGIVTNTTLTHATPAAVYAHVPERSWENDSLIPAKARAAGCQDIARQFLANAKAGKVHVALAGGHMHFLGTDRGGRRLNADDDLIAEWRAATGGHYLSTAEGLESLEAFGSDDVLGLFAPSHMSYELHRRASIDLGDKAPRVVSKIDDLLADFAGGSAPVSDPADEPSLTDMTAAAITLLSRRENGYYLMVEGGRIDHGHHEGIAALALTETQEFANAVAKAVAMTDPAETLILVTADHSHPFVMAGYPTRGNPILGRVKENDSAGMPTGELSLALDGKPYTTLGYWTGAGAVDGKRDDISDEDTTAPDYRQQAVVPTGVRLPGMPQGIGVGKHGGEDVPLYATGPGAHLVGGVMEQHVIFHIISHAFGWTNSAGGPN